MFYVKGSAVSRLSLHSGYDWSLKRTLKHVYLKQLWLCLVLNKRAHSLLVLNKCFRYFLGTIWKEINFLLLFRIWRLSIINGVPVPYNANLVPRSILS